MSQSCSGPSRLLMMTMTTRLNTSCRNVETTPYYKLEKVQYGAHKSHSIQNIASSYSLQDCEVSMAAGDGF